MRSVVISIFGDVFGDIVTLCEGSSNPRACVQRRSGSLPIRRSLIPTSDRKIFFSRRAECTDRQRRLTSSGGGFFSGGMLNVGMLKMGMVDFESCEMAILRDGVFGYGDLGNREFGFSGIENRVFDICDFHIPRIEISRFRVFTYRESSFRDLRF